MKITVIGGGNIGSWLAAQISSKKYPLCLYTSDPDQWQPELEVYDNYDNLLKVGRLDKITADLNEAIEYADVIIATWPSHTRPTLFNDMTKSTLRGKIIAVMPGGGGVELFAGPLLLEQNAVLVGFERVAAITRIRERGKSVYLLGAKKNSTISILGRCFSDRVAAIFEELLSLPCNVIEPFLNITLTPSNPILHTARIYQLFRDYTADTIYERCEYFYEEWHDEASEMLIGLDIELQELCHKLLVAGLDMSGVVSLKEHYESSNVASMSAKLRSINAFKGIKTPMIKVDGGFVPDFESRYFLEDFNYGLAIAAGFCRAGDGDTPYMDKVLDWFWRLPRYRDLKAPFRVKNRASLENFNIKTLNDIVKYYITLQADHSPRYTQLTSC